MKKIYMLFSILFSVGIGEANAQYDTIHNFNLTDGAFPSYSRVTISGGKMYGMVPDGGVHSDGCIFVMDTNGSGYKDIYDFTGAYGSNPSGSLVISGTVLYGMTQYGGGNAVGCIFSVNTDGTGYKDLFDFNGPGNGASPWGSLTLLGDVLFGMTSGGGGGNNGTIFSIHTDGTRFKVLLAFNQTDGSSAYGSLTLSGTKLFGMTYAGGVNDYGVVFSIDTNGKGYKDLLDFNMTNGWEPYGDVTLSGKKLYGMTFAGGAHSEGDIFSLDTSGGGFKDMYDFNNINGSYGSLVIAGKHLYGMTLDGGTSQEGTIFSIDTNGTAYSTLYNFNTTMGNYPHGSLALSGITLYGMASAGLKNDGVIFKFKDTAIHTSSIPYVTASAKEVLVYPNPNNGKFTIQLSIPGERPLVEIYNALGQKVYSQFTTRNSQFTIDLSSQPNGIYLYRVITESGNLVGEGKLIIQK